MTIKQCEKLAKKFIGMPMHQVNGESYIKWMQQGPLILLTNTFYAYYPHNKEIYAYGIKSKNWVGPSKVTNNPPLKHAYVYTYYMTVYLRAKLKHSPLGKIL